MTSFGRHKAMIRTDNDEIISDLFREISSLPILDGSKVHQRVVKKFLMG